MVSYELKLSPRKVAELVDQYDLTTPFSLLDKKTFEQEVELIAPPSFKAGDDEVGDDVILYRYIKGYSNYLPFGADRIQTSFARLTGIPFNETVLYGKAAWQIHELFSMYRKDLQTEQVFSA